MSFFKNLRIGSKILSVFLVALIATCVVGGIALSRISQIDAMTKTLVDDLAVVQKIADDVGSQLLRVRFNANKFIFQKDQADLENYYLNVEEFSLLFDEANLQIQQSERVEILGNIENLVDEYYAVFDQIKEIMEIRDQISKEELDEYGPFVEQKLRYIRQIAFRGDDTQSANNSGNAQAAVLLMRFNSFKYIDTGDPEYIELFDQYYEEALNAFVSLNDSLTNEKRKIVASETREAVENYYQGFHELERYFNQQTVLQDQLVELGAEIEFEANRMSESIHQDFIQASVESAQVVKSTRVILITIIVCVVLFCLIAGFLLSRAITKPLEKITKTAEQIAERDLNSLAEEMNYLAQGDLTRMITVESLPLDIDNQDELGVMAKAFNEVIFKLKAVENSFADMIVNLNRTISEVSESAEMVDSASEHLSNAAEQSHMVSAQITTTIQQVATGIQSQTNAITNTTGTVDHLGQAIRGVAQGAQEQAEAINLASESTEKLSLSIQQVLGNTLEVTKGSVNASEISLKGSQTVKETIEGMGIIKEKVDQSARSVAEMGKRSEEIGAIVSTIEDIASQTNLLALNAAIEAARAGEHGKGFAVVADEVRKLAERSSAATKEIGTLIKGIQATIDEAVKTMNEGTQEVESGVKRANESGNALREILTASETVTKQAEMASKAVEEMNIVAGDLVGAIDSVSAVVEENTAATEEMSASSSEVTQSFESIAAVSEENSASVEEVSASTEEMNAQSEEVNASSQNLATLAQQLSQIVGKFNLGTGSDFAKQIELYRVAHLKWVSRIEKMLAGDLVLDAEKAGSDHECLLGQWYFSKANQNYIHIPEFIAIEKPHTELHAIVSKTIVAYQGGDEIFAEAQLPEIERVSNEVVALLNKLQEVVIEG
ncbi:MAG: CZB domain-containing protein [Anaerolineaceae bacterium]|nr:CZB domain-containing protein [Anaerolineaceae bacterium]